MKVYHNILELVGNTPLVELSKLDKEEGTKATVYAKIEAFNPAGSAKDRIALNMIETAEKEGKIKPGATIIEPTSGNTGIGLALVCAQKGYHLILTMPETMSVERRNLIKAYGAKVELTEGSKGMKGAIAKAEELAKEIPGSFIPSQFSNPANPQKHYETTGPEIWNDTDGKVDIFVAGVGTGGTLSGVGKYLKEKNPNVEVVAVEPEESPLLSKGHAGPHKIQGIAAGFVPETLDTSIYNKVMTVSNKDNPLKVGDTIQIAGQEVEIVCALSGGLYPSEYSVICSQETLSRLTGEQNYSMIGVQLGKDAADDTVKQISDLAESNVIFTDQRESNRQDRATYLASVFIVYSFLAIIAMITLFNIVNCISMSVTARTKQYGAMRAVGMDGDQLTQMIAAEAFTYSVSGLVIGGGIGVALSRFLYIKLLTRYFGTPWNLPIKLFAIIIAFSSVAAIVAIHAPAKRMRNMAVTETINEL